jgi:uncharacterized protein (TIGR00369 family)
MSSADQAVPAFGVHIPFVALLGFEMKSFENGHSEIHFTPQPEHTNSFAVAHGGAVMTLLDVSMATASRSVDKSLGIVTIEMKTSFMRPASGPLIARGTLKHRTKTLAFAESSIYDANNQLCAHATGTFRYVTRRPATPNNPSTLSTD